jgi:hypothetical protein
MARPVARELIAFLMIYYRRILTKTRERPSAIRDFQPIINAW